jgi:glycosyltransferase involved in cell wall biosynthesis
LLALQIDRSFFMPAADLHNDSSLPAPVVYSVVVPVYNSAPVLARLYARLIAVMVSLERRFELVFVDDDSADASWSLLAEIARTDPRVLAIRLAHNVGQGDATLAGLRASSGEVLVTIDDDLQYMPEEIPNLLALLDAPERYDAVFGVPATRRHPAWRRFASSVANMCVSPVLGKPASLHFSAFRAMRRPVVERLLALSWPDPFLSALLFQVTRGIGAGAGHTRHLCADIKPLFAPQARPRAFGTLWGAVGRRSTQLRPFCKHDRRDPRRVGVRRVCFSGRGHHYEYSGRCWIPLRNSAWRKG